VAAAILAQSRKPRPTPRSLVIPSPPTVPGAEDEAAQFAKMCPCNKESSESGSSSKSESAEESGGLCNCDEFDVVAADLKKMKKLTRKLFKTQALYDAQQQWLDAAQLGLTKIDRQIEQSEATKADLETELQALRKEKKEIMNKAASVQIKRDLTKAVSELARVTAEHDRILSEKEELSEASASLTKTILQLRKRLNTATQAIKTIKKLPKIM